MLRNKALKYAAFAGCFFGASLALALVGRTNTDAAVALALLALGITAAALAMIADDEDRRAGR